MIAGEAAERVVYLFCVISRRDFWRQVNLQAPNCGGPLTAERHDGCADAVETISREDAASLLLLYMANTAEQTSTAAGDPRPWLERVSRMGVCLREWGASVPPVFARCSALVSHAEEEQAIASYRQGLDAILKNPEAAARYFATAAATCPYVAEPGVWNAYLCLCRGDSEGAWRSIAGARETFSGWGTPWDKRLDYGDWLRLVSLMEEDARHGTMRIRLFFRDASDGREMIQNLKQRLSTLDDYAGHQATVVASRSVQYLEHRMATPLNYGLAMGLSAQEGRSRFHRYIDSFVNNHTNPRMTVYPDLISKPWHDPGQFPIVEALEQNFEGIKREVLAIQAADFQRESEKIRRTGSWDVFFLYELGLKNAANCQRCPLTTRIVEGHPTVRTLAGLIYVSQMKPETQIAPHRAPTNMRLRCHLGIQVPRGDCGLNVGGETRAWTEGKCLVFDDHFRHEAWNRTALPRIVLIVDLWHPDLTESEIALLEGMHRYADASARHLNRYWTNNVEARAAARKESD